MEGVAGWEGSRDGRGRGMGGVAGWKESRDGRGRGMEGVAELEGSLKGWAIPAARRHRFMSPRATKLASIWALMQSHRLVHMHASARARRAAPLAAASWFDSGRQCNFKHSVPGAAVYRIHA